MSPDNNGISTGHNFSYQPSFSAAMTSWFLKRMQDLNSVSPIVMFWTRRKSLFLSFLIILSFTSNGWNPFWIKFILTFSGIHIVSTSQLVLGSSSALSYWVCLLIYNAGSSKKWIVFYGRNLRINFGVARFRLYTILFWFWSSDVSLFVHCHMIFPRKDLDPLSINFTW